MCVVRFHARNVNSLACRVVGGEAVRTEYCDEVTPGLSLRVSPSGSRTFVFNYRVGSGSTDKRRMTLGRLPGLSLSEARRMASEVRLRVAQGYDPVVERRNACGDRSLTVAGLVDRFIEGYCERHQVTWRQTESFLRNHVVSRYGRYRAGDLTRSDVFRVLDDLTASGKDRTANLVQAHLRKCYNWGISRDLVEFNPVSGIERQGRERSRDRVLSDGEVVRIWEAADEIGGVKGAFVKMLFLTGQRISEVAGMTWGEVDLAGATWGLDRERTKMDRAHLVPLSGQALAVLDSLPRIEGVGHVFSSGRRGDKAFSGFSKLKAEIDRISGVSGWRFHDIRRTVASGCAKIGVSQHILSRILNHASHGDGITGVYNRFSYGDEKRRALSAWANVLDGMVGGERSNVISMRRKGDGGIK